MAVSANWAVLLVGVLITIALLLGLQNRAPDFEMHVGFADVESVYGSLYV